MEGLLLSHHAPTGETVSAVYYKTFRGEHLKRVLARMAAGTKVLHDNAVCHKATLVTSFLEEQNWKTLLLNCYNYFTPKPINT